MFKLLDQYFVTDVGIVGLAGHKNTNRGKTNTAQFNVHK